MSTAVEAKRSARATQRRTKALEKSLMHDFVSDVEELVKKVTDIPGVDLATVRNKVAGAIAGARESVENATDTVRSTTRAGVETADEYVRGYPWAAMGVAIGIGLLLGFSSRR
jgi:ElaB/YqjD/DUF883 family membrane-anchored ribosome-binding protein